MRRLIVIDNSQGYLAIDPKLMDGRFEFMDLGADGLVKRKGSLTKSAQDAQEFLESLTFGDLRNEGLPPQVERTLLQLEALLAAQCMGSGYCCVKAQCQTSLAIHGAQPLCPELGWNGTRHVCKLMLLPGAEGARYREAQYAGEGCSSSLNSWRREPLKDRRHLAVTK